MEVVIASLDALLHKATNANLDRPDPAALEAFCAVLADSPNGSYIATRVIASRIRSPHPTEALLALEVLDACMKRCDAVFHAEVDKFRFLNEMIKLVSPKYYGNKTAPAVRQKVLTLMHSWTVDYPREIKIRDAYEMLKKQGVVKDVPPPQPPVDETTTTSTSRSKEAIFEDEERSKMLKKLLQSKNPDDIQAANRLIKTMVREGERRIEAVTRRITELHTVNNNARLLDEMLDQYRPGISSQEDLELIKELHLECSRLRPTVFKLAAETQQNEDMLNEVLEVSDELGRVFEKYTLIIMQGKAQEETRPRNQLDSIILNGTGNSLLDLASPSEQVIHASSSIQETIEKNNSNLEVLGDIFSSVDNEKEIDESSEVNFVPVLKPVNLMSSGKETSFNIKENNQPVNKGLDELNALGEELLKSSLPLTSKYTSSFNTRPEKVSMNLMGKNSATTPIEIILNEMKTDNYSLQPQNNPNDLLDLDFLISKTLQSESKSNLQHSNDDAMVDISNDEHLIDAKPKVDKESGITLIEYLKSINVKCKEDPISTDPISKEIKTPTSLNISTEKQPYLVTPTNDDNLEISPIQEIPKSIKLADIKPLTDIKISLESIKPGRIPPMTVFEEDDGITVVLHLAKNKPRPDVSVIVVSTTSRNPLPIDEFKFHAVVPKGCKVRLLQPSGESFQAFNPFLPPAAITQVMLIGRPIVEDLPKVFLKFVISYLCQDDTISEMGEVKSLPLDDV